MSLALQDLEKRIAALRREGRDKETEPLLRRTVRLACKEYGEGHPAHATLLNDLGGLYRTTGRYAESEACFLKAREILAATVGENAPGCATCRNNLSLLHQDMRRHHEAIRPEERALEIVRATTTANDVLHLSSPNALARLRSRRGSDEATEAPYRWP